MAVATRIEKAVQQWLKDTQGFMPHIATESGADQISSTELLKLAQQCEWVEEKDYSSLHGVHAKGLMMGYGDIEEYLASSGKAEGTEAHFLMAYRQ